MKKLFAVLLAVLMVVSMATVASAETTTLTTTVPDASYTLNVPKEVPVAFGSERTDIGEVTVTGSSGFAEGKNLAVTLTYSDFACVDVSTTIPFNVGCSYSINGAYKDMIPSGDVITFLGQEDGTAKEMHTFVGKDSGGHDTNCSASVYFVDIASSDWGKALGGDYTATITYTAEVVVE